MRAFAQFAARALAAVALAAAACDDHEPELERRGGPIPDVDVTPTPPFCGEDDGAGGEGGMVVTTRIRFCQAEVVLRDVCQRCHQNPPLHGAPFSLVTYEDTQQPFGNGRRRWQRMREVVESGFMPLKLRLDPPVESLTCEQKATLLGWLDQCALPEGGTDCSAHDDTLVTCEGSGGAQP